MILCDLTTCYSIGRAWFQLVKLKRDKLLSSFAFKTNSRRYNKAALINDVADVETHFPGELEKIRVWFRDYKTPDGRGLHSSTFQLNLSRS